LSPPREADPVSRPHRDPGGEGAFEPAATPSILGVRSDRPWPRPQPCAFDILTAIDQIEPWRAAWDELAVRSGRPFCSPEWMLTWWRHAAPAGARLRLIVARDGTRLVGVAPLFVVRGRARPSRYRVLGAGTSMRVEPVAIPGEEARAGAAFARALGAADPRPDLMLFEGIPSSSPWPRLLAAALPGDRGPWTHLDVGRPAPILRLEGRTYDEWLGGQSRNFRGQMRRARRQLDEAGAVIRVADREGIGMERDIRAFATLHHARWDWRGGSAVLDARIERMLVEAASRLGPLRFRLWLIEVDGRAISAHLFVCAGGEVAYWLGGFDEAWARQRPAMVALLRSVEHAFASGDDRVDFGGGDQPYKYRFADGEDLLEWVTLVPRDRRYAAARAGLFPRQAYRMVSDRLSEDARERIRTIGSAFGPRR
jgi:CelD/BcsL family acetyltransferase involved in cellulose biosynthesis